MRSSVWEKAMASYKGKPGLRYLEIGVFEGRSMMWMLENILTDPTSSAVGIDPFLADYKDRYRANLTKSGHESRVTTIVGYSQVELRKLPLDSFDIIYVDGSHTASDVLEDAVLSLRLLKRRGTLIFDDYRWSGLEKLEPPENRPERAVEVFYAIYGKQFEVIHNGYQVIFLRK
jgi:predicted O-methyltransferase YrrM